MIYTIGHSNHAIRGFIDLLQRARVQVLIDVRTTPQSRYYQHFNRFELSKSVISIARIDYQWQGVILGGLNDIPIDDPLFAKQMSLVLHQGKTKNVALMCSEGDPSECHRASKLSAWILRNSDQKVTHILKNGTIDGRELERSQKKNGSIRVLNLLSSQAISFPWYCSI